MSFGDFWLQSNSNGKGKKFSLKDLQTLKPEDIAKNPKLQKLITLFDSDGSGNLELNELQSVFSDLKSAAKDDILSDNELGLYLSNKFKDKDIKVEDVKELLNATSSKELQTLNYTDLDGNNISDKFENGELVERTITNTDENGITVEVAIFYEEKKPIKQIQMRNNEIIATISYDFSTDPQNPTTTTIFKNKDGVVEEVNTPQKRTLTLYKTDSIDNFDKTQNHRLQQVVISDKAQYVAEYDGRGNTYIIVQNSETPELIAQKFGIRLADLIRVNKGLTKTTILQAGQKLIVPSEINADSKVMKPRKSEGEVKQRAAQHAFGKVYDKIFASALDEYEIKPENAGKDVYEYATKYLIRKGAKKTEPNFNARVNDLANELIALNGRDAKYTAGSKIKYIKKTLNQNTINQLKDAGMIPNQENQLFFARFNYLTPQQQTNVIEVLKQCKARGITDPQKINAEILRYYPEIQMFETDKKVLQKPTKAMARSYMAHYLLEQIDAIISVYNQTATADQSLWTLGTGLIVELQDLLHISTKFINDNLGTCIAEGDSRVNLAPMLNKIREECLALVALAEHEEQYMDESFDKKKNAPGWEGSAFDEHFNNLFYGKSMNYDAVTTYLQAVQEFQKAPEKDRNNKNSQAYKKIEAATNKLNQQLPGFQDVAKRIEGWSKGTQIVGGLTDLGIQVAMLYLSGGGSAIARSSMYVGNATRYSVGVGMSRMAASRFGSTAVGRFLVKDGTQFITREGSAILASMVTSSAETAAFFQGTKVLAALEDGKVTGEEVAVINEGFEGLFKFGMVGSAIAGPLGAKASELTSKLLNSERAIASTMKLAVEGKGTTLDKVLKALCENSNAVSKITEFGTSFSINAGYMAVADNTGYGEAMGNLAQMDAVSKLVVAMLGGKNTAFLTPQKVQQIKTSLAGYEVKLSVYKGQKIYEVTDRAGAKTRLANEQELFMFIVDREVAELTRPNVDVPKTDAWDRFNVTIEPNEELADNSLLTQLRGTIDQELKTYDSTINLIKESLGIKGDLKLELQNPKSVAQTFGDDLHLRLTDKENNISFKFDKKTGKLVAILTPNEAYNVQNGTFVSTRMEKEFRAEDIMPEGITEEQRRINSTPTYMEMFVSKEGKQFSYEQFVESKVTGEFEIYDIDPSGKKYKIGLAELMPDGGKYVEKTLTSLDGTKTDYVYKDDATGNRFLYYKITDSNGKVLFETTKKYKVLSENHYQTATNGEYYDVEILEDKVVVTKLDNAKNKTSEKIEYKIEDFTEEDYAEINERAESSVRWGSEERRKENITNMLDEIGIGNTVDRKILPMLKQLSGEEWFKLSDSGARLLIGAAEGERNAGSIGGIIKLSDGLADLLAVFEHEAGHEIFHHLRLNEDAELKKIYEEEKAAYTSTFTDDGNLSIAYFLRNNYDETNRGINETVAETNLLTNMHQQENSIQARSALLQHYFPRTLAHIANKLNHATTRAAIESHIDANGRLEKGYIIDERSNQPIKVDAENLQVEKQSAEQGKVGFISINDKFGNSLGHVSYNLVEVDGQKSLHFEGLVSNVEGAGIGSRIIQELTLISRDLGAEGRLTASASPMANRGGKLTNIEFYYKLGFKAVDPAKDAAIREYIERGEEVPLQLNIFTEIELGPKYAKVDKNLTRTDLVDKLQQTGFSEEDIQTIKEKASNVDGALTLIDLLSSTAYKNNAKKLLTDEFFEQVNGTRFDFTKLTLDELNKIADNLGGRHSVDELSQYLFRNFVRGSETMEEVSVRMEILDKIKILEEEFGNPIDITDSWSLRPEDFKEASVETIIFTAKVAKALGDKTIYAEDFKRFADIKEYTEQDITDIAELSGRVKLISFHDKTSLSDLVGIKNLFDSECKADIRRICEIIENTQAGKLTENSFRRLMRGEVKDAELFAQILKNRKENNNASSQEAIPTIISLIEKYPDYKQDLIDICDYSSRTDDFTKIIELWQNNPAEKDVIKQLAIAKRNINQINIVLPLLNTPNRASVLEIVLSKNIKFESADDIQAIIDIKNQNQDIAGTLQTYLSTNKISFGVEDANKFVEFVNKNPENRDFILRMAENSNMDVNAMERVIALQEQYKNDAKKLSLIDYLATDGKFDLMTILRTLEDVQTHPEFEDIISTNRTVAGFIDSSNENKSSVERNSARAIAEEKANPADIALLKDMLGDYYDRLKWESMVDSKMTATQINEVVNDLIEKSTAFTRISFVERNYGKNPIWASSVQKTMNKAVVRLQRGESFQEVLDNIATDYQNEARSHSKADEPFNQTGVRRGLGDREIGFSWTKYDDVLYSEYKDRFDAVSRQYRYGKPSPYEDVKLTQIDGKNHQMDHPYDKGGQNADNALRHCESCYKEIQPLIEKVNRGEKLTADELEYAKLNIAEIHFLITNAMPYTRGSAGIADCLTRSIYKALGEEAPILKKGVGLDLEAFARSLDDYQTNWDSFFVERGKQEITEPSASNEINTQTDVEFTARKQSVLNVLYQTKHKTSYLDAESITPENIAIVEFVLKDEKLKNNYQVLSMLKSVDSSIKSDFVSKFLNITKDKIENYDNGLQVLVESVESQEISDSYISITQTLLEHGLNKTSKGLFSSIVMSTKTMDGASARNNVINILERYFKNDKNKVYEIINLFGENNIELYEILKHLPEKDKKLDERTKTLTKFFDTLKEGNMDISECLEKLTQYVYASTNTIKHYLYRADQKVDSKKNTFSDLESNISEDDINKAVNEILNTYSQHAKIMHDDLVRLGFNRIGEFEDRVKAQASLHDKIKNYLDEHPKAKLEEAIADVRDAYATRTILKSKDLTMHPEVIALLESGNREGAILRAAEIQSQPAVEILKGMIQAQADGKSDYTISRLTNYVSEGGIPYFSEKQLAELRQFAADRGIKINFVERIKETDDAFDEIDKTNYNPTTKAQPSGYTAFQMNLTTKDGKVIEWQCRGDKINEFAEGEHIAYDLRTGKDIIGNNEELRPLYQPIQDLLSSSKMPEEAYNSYTNYLTDYYTYLRKQELGFHSKKPKLADYEVNGFKFDSKLEASNLIKLHNIAKDLVDGKITQSQAIELYECDMEKVDAIKRDYMARYRNGRLFYMPEDAIYDPDTGRKLIEIPKSLRDRLQKLPYTSKDYDYSTKNEEHINLIIQEYLDNPALFELKERCFSNQTTVEQIREEFLGKELPLDSRFDPDTGHKFTEIPDNLKAMLFRNPSDSKFDHVTGKNIDEAIQEYLDQTNEIPASIRELVTRNTRDAKYDRVDGICINDVINQYLRRPTVFSIREKIYNGLQAVPSTEIMPQRVIDMVKRNPRFAEIDSETGANINDVIMDLMRNGTYFEFKTKIRESINNEPPKKIASFTLSKDGTLKKSADIDATKIKGISRLTAYKPMKAQKLTSTDGIPEELKSFIMRNPEGAATDIETGIRINHIIEEYLNNPKEFNFEESMRNATIEQLSRINKNLAMLADKKTCIGTDKKVDRLSSDDLQFLRKIAEKDQELAEYLLTKVKNYEIHDEHGNVGENLPHGYYQEVYSFLNNYSIQEAKTVLMGWHLNGHEALKFMEKYKKLVPTIDKELRKACNITDDITFTDNTVSTQGRGDEGHVTLTASNGTSYKFDIKTGKLFATETERGDVFYNERTGDISQVRQTSEVRNVSSSIEGELSAPVKQPVITNMETIVYSQNGKRFSHEEFIESKIVGEFEIYDYSPDGSLHKIGLAEVSPNGEKSIERTLVSLDGTKTDYVYHDDPQGNRFLYCKISDVDGKVLHETRKTFKVVDENHFISTTNGQAYDIEFLADKVVITKLNSNNQKTSEKVEYKIKDYSQYETDRELKLSTKKLMSIAKARNVDLNDSSPENRQNIYDVLREYYAQRGLTKTVDKRLLPLIKQMSGEEWFKLDSADLLSLDYISGNIQLDLNAMAMGDVMVMVGRNMVDRMSVAEHEFGHITFEKLKLYEDTELRKIYETERSNLIGTFGEEFIGNLEYFINDANDNTGYRGLNETAAETNLIMNMHSQWNMIAPRTVLLQHYFPKTIAYIANKATAENMQNLK